jgi:uncharacterized protein with FMN-binding domain
MKRVLAALSLTIAGVVMLLQYHIPPLPPVRRAIASPTPATRVLAGAPPRPKSTIAVSTPPPLRTRAPLPTAAPTRPTAPPEPVHTVPPTPVPHRTPPPTPAASRTYTGTAFAACNYGDVVVQITVKGNRISDAQAPTYPTDRRQSQQINQGAIPQLDQETIQAQSSNIDTVSGATCTSDGYRQSLQSAIDQWKGA